MRALRTAVPGVGTFPVARMSSCHVLSAMLTDLVFTVHPLIRTVGPRLSSKVLLGAPEVTAQPHLGWQQPCCGAVLGPP